jgi:uncharacterized membrane protein
LIIIEVRWIFMYGIKKYAIMFSVGGAGYAIIELLYRRRTHWTMIIAGGICFVIFSLIEKRHHYKSPLFKAVLCSSAVCAVELLFGIIFNLYFKMNVWDYSAEPYNLWGQICPLFALLWGALGLVAMPLVARLERALDKWLISYKKRA